MCAILLLQHHTHHVLHVDACLTGKGRTNRRFIQNSLQLGAGIIAHHPRQVFHVDTVRNLFRFKIVGDDLLRIGRRGRLKSDFSVKPSGTAQGARQLADIVCRGDHKHTGVLHIVDPRLHSGIFRRVAVGIILVGKFVHVVQKDNGRCFCLRAGKGLCNSIDKGVAALVAAYRDGVQPALLHKAPRQKRLAQARVAIQQQSMGQAGAHLFIDLPVAEHIAQLQQLALGGLVSDDLVKCVHGKISFSNFTVSIALI